MILFIDDERQYIDNVVVELKLLKFEVIFCSGVDEALQYLRDASNQFDAIVCDVMLPHGAAFTAAETEDNRITGLVFLAKLRAMGNKLPVVLLTYLEPGRAPVDETALRYPPCIVIRKKEKWSFEIAEAVSDFVKR